MFYKCLFYTLVFNVSSVLGIAVLGGGVPQSGPCAGGAAAGRTHSRTGQWFLWSPSAAELDPTQ